MARHATRRRWVGRLIGVEWRMQSTASREHGRGTDSQAADWSAADREGRNRLGEEPANQRELGGSVYGPTIATLQKPNKENDRKDVGFDVFLFLWCDAINGRWMDSRDAAHSTSSHLVLGPLLATLLQWVPSRRSLVRAAFVFCFSTDNVSWSDRRLHWKKRINTTATSFLAISKLKPSKTQ